jgi:hypothetical protein
MSEKELVLMLLGSKLGCAHLCKVRNPWLRKASLALTPQGGQAGRCKEAFSRTKRSRERPNQDSIDGKNP